MVHRIFFGKNLAIFFLCSFLSLLMNFYVKRILFHDNEGRKVVETRPESVLIKAIPKFAPSTQPGCAIPTARALHCDSEFSQKYNNKSFC
jgi:hypothetical protein